MSLEKITTWTEGIPDVDSHSFFFLGPKDLRQTELLSDGPICQVHYIQATHCENEDLG